MPVHCAIPAPAAGPSASGLSAAHAAFPAESWPGHDSQGPHVGSCHSHGSLQLANPRCSEALSCPTPCSLHCTFTWVCPGHCGHVSMLHLHDVDTKGGMLL